MAPPKVNDEYHNQIKKASEELDKLLSYNKHYAPDMLRLALHDAGIYRLDIGADHYLIKRGPNGSIRTPSELNHPSNRDLTAIVDLCDRVKNNNKYEKITYADLYQLAGIAALKITGGPDIGFVPGREDSTQYPKEGQLPQDGSVLEEIRKRMGLEEKHMVALVGGLCQWDQQLKSEGQEKNSDKSGGQEKNSDKSVGQGKNSDKSAGQEKNSDESGGQEKNSDQSGGQEKNSDQSGGQEKNSDDKKAQDSYQFDNLYFKGLEKREPDNPLLKRGFRKWVDKYAKDGDTFRTDYAAAHKKVSELGMSAATSEKGGPQTRNRARLVQGIGIAVVATAIIIGFFLSRRSK